MFLQERERFAKDANVLKMAESNIRMLSSKSSANMSGGWEHRQLFVGCWKRSQEIVNFFEIPAELKTTHANN